VSGRPSPTRRTTRHLPVEQTILRTEEVVDDRAGCRVHDQPPRRTPFPGFNAPAAEDDEGFDVAAGPVHDQLAAAFGELGQGGKFGDLDDRHVRRGRDRLDRCSFVMSQKMLRGIRDRAEGRCAAVEDAA
jgi:hypothetical protein